MGGEQKGRGTIPEVGETALLEMVPPLTPGAGQEVPDRHPAGAAAQKKQEGQKKVKSGKGVPDDWDWNRKLGGKEDKQGQSFPPFKIKVGQHGNSKEGLGGG